MKLHRLKIAFLGFLFVLGLGSKLPAAVVVSNLDQATFSTSPISSIIWFGNRFVTDGSALGFNLESVTLALGTPTNTSSGLFVAIFSDDSSHPGVQLALLSGTATPATAGEYTYTSTGLSLAPNTSYWIVSGVPTGSGDYLWEMTNSNLYTGSWSIPTTATHIYSFNQGVLWQPAQDGFPRQFSISATPVPEPSSFALLGLGAGTWIFLRKRR